MAAGLCREIRPDRDAIAGRQTTGRLAAEEVGYVRERRLPMSASGGRATESATSGKAGGRRPGVWQKLGAPLWDFRGFFINLALRV